MAEAGNSIIVQIAKVGDLYDYDDQDQIIIRTDYISHSVLIFGIEKSTSGNTRSNKATPEFYRLKDSMPLESTGKPEERKIPIGRLTIENAQQSFANYCDVPLQDDEFVISNIGYLVKFV